MVQVVESIYSAVATGTTVMILDDTIPQNTEGIEFMTLSITPKSTTNKLHIEARAQLASSTGAADILIGAIFQDTTADALAANGQFWETDSSADNIQVFHSMIAGTTSATTFKFRAGSNAAGTTTFNGRVGARQFGTATKSFMRIIEYKAS